MKEMAESLCTCERSIKYWMDELIAYDLIGKSYYMKGSVRYNRYKLLVITLDDEELKALERPASHCDSQNGAEKSPSDLQNEPSDLQPVAEGIRTSRNNNNKDKYPYAENVTLTETEHSKLIADYGEVATKKAIDKLSAYKLQHGRRYKSDYGAILSWAMRAAIEKGAVPAPTRRSNSPPCAICGGPTERDHGYWLCKKHGRCEDEDERADNGHGSVASVGDEIRPVEKQGDGRDEVAGY
jgi:hypothetical protein